MNEYLNANETAALVALIASVSPRVVIEIGCNEGRTARTVLKALPTVEKYIGVDVPSGHVPTLDCQRSEVSSFPGWCAADDERFFLLAVERGSMGLGPQDLEPCDAVFIDGDHSRRAVTHDSALARALVQPGGIIVWHDYRNPAVEVTEVLDHLRDEGWPIVALDYSWLAFCRISV